MRGASSAHKAAVNWRRATICLQVVGCVNKGMDVLHLVGDVLYAFMTRSLLLDPQSALNAFVLCRWLVV